MTKNSIIVSIGVVVVLGLLAFAMQRGGDAPQEQAETQEVTQETQEEPAAEEEQEQAEEPEEASQEQKIPINLSVNLLPQLQAREETQTAALAAVDGSNSSGTAYRLAEEGKLYHAVTASMPDPAPGLVYEGWLVQPSPLQFFSTGVMERQTDGSFLLEYSAEQTYPTYTRVVITEETQVDETPEAHILEGDF